MAVTAPAPRGLEARLERAAEPFDATVELRVLASRAAAREELEQERADAVLRLDADRIVFRAEADDELAAIADFAVRSLRRHLPPAPELTAVSLGATGNLRVYPAGALPPLASALNFTAGRTRANNAVLSLGTGGAITAQYDMAAGTFAHLLVDVTGYFQ